MRQVSAIHSRSRRSAWSRLVDFRRDRRGAAAVEYALILPVMLLLFMGIIDGAFYFWSRHTIEFAVEETGRRLMVKTSSDAAAVAAATANVAVTVKALALAFDESTLVTATTIDTVTTLTGSTVTYVTIQSNYTFHFMFASIFTSAGIPITAKARVPMLPPLS